MTKHTIASRNDFLSTLTPPQKRSLGTDVVDRLRDAICSGRLPPKERLREEALAEFLQVSRGPIREALVQLEREGLVIREPNRGATVARLSYEDLEEVYSLRMALERLAVQGALRHASAQHLDEMQTIVNEMGEALRRGITGQEAATLDLQFHEVIYQASQNKRLYEFWSVLRPQIHIFLLTRTVANPDFRDHLLISHMSILDAIRAKDEPRTMAIIEDHLQGSYRRVLISYTQATNAADQAAAHDESS